MNKKTLRELAIAVGYEEKEIEFVERGLATNEEVQRWRKNRELSERFGIEISY